MRHVSSVSPAGEATMACVWYEGSREGAADVSIYLSFFDENRSQWAAPAKLIDRRQCSSELGRYVRKLGNPMLFNDGNGRLWLFFSSVVAGGWSGSSLNYKVSQDGGRSWSRAEKIVLSPFFNLTNNVKNGGVRLTDGSFLIPVYHELGAKYSGIVHVTPGKGRPVFEVRRMTRSGKAVQPVLLPLGERRLAAFFRNMGPERGRFILSAGSGDAGKSWSDIVETDLPNPNAGFDMIVTSDGGWLGAINDSFSDRSNLVIVLSRDNGRTWKRLRVLEDRPGREYSYPSLSRSRSGLYHLTYTYERKMIKHIVFNDAWIGRAEAGL
jgi:predicted neuraminidase